MFISIGAAATLIGVSCSTLRRWDRDQTFVSQFRTTGGHRRYKLSQILIFCAQIGKKITKTEMTELTAVRAVTYARVSGSKQKQDLERQEQHLRQVANKRQWTVIQQYRDIGSGLNDTRPALIRLIKELPILQPDVILCTYRDRLARFGTRLLQTICDLFGTTIYESEQTNPQTSLQDQLATDVIAIITSFAGKIHRRRRGQHGSSKSF